MLTLCKSTVLGAAFLAGVAIAASADPLCCTPTGPYAAPYGGGIHAGGFGGFHGGGFHDGFAGLHHAVNPSLSLSAPTNSPLQEQMREDYATGLMGAQRELLQQNPSGLGRQEQEIGQELNGYTPR